MRTFPATAARICRWLVLLQIGTWGLLAQNAAIPKELEKTFDRYRRAWVGRDWGRIYDLNAPQYQKKAVEMFGNREKWIKHQDVDFKDKIISIQSVATYQLSDTVFTFETVTNGKRPNGKEFNLRGYTTFELIDGRWYLVEPLPPRNPPPTAAQPGTGGASAQKKTKGFWED